MSTLALRLRHAFAGLVALSVLALSAPDAHATHFRYGTLKWEKTGETATEVTIKVTTESAWKRSFFSPLPQLGIPLNVTGQLIGQPTAGGGNVFSIPLRITPSAINTSEDWFVGSGQDTFTFLKSALPIRIFWDSTARLTGLQDGNGTGGINYRVESIMSVTPNAASPVASTLPIITVGFPLQAAKFFIPAGDVEGDALTWSIAPNGPFPIPDRSHLVKAAPDGRDDIPPATLSINPLTGEVTWATDQEFSPADTDLDLYAVQFIITDSKGAETPLDVILNLLVTVPNPPVATINGSENQHIVDVRPNNLVTFVLTGTDNDAGAIVTLSTGALPVGASMSPSLPTSGTSPRSSTFNWTPTLAQAGNSYPISFAVTDEDANQDTISAIIRVLENFEPTITCPAIRTVEATGPAGADVTLEATVGDVDPDALTIRWFVDGVLVETDTASGPGNTVVSLTRSYGFLPAPVHPIRVEVTDGQLTRECTSQVTVVDTTPPTITAMPDLVLEATGPGGAVAIWIDPTATDLVDGIRPVTCVPVSGTLFPIAAPGPVTTVTCTASDTRGNTATEEFTVTVQDTRAPVITVPNTIWEATSPAGAVATFVATAFDLVDLNVTPVLCTPASGSTFHLGVTTVECTATDSHGNQGFGTGTVTVQDTIPPVITNNPGNLVREATGPAGAAVTWPALIATDIADPNVPVTCVPASGSTFAITPPAPITPVVCTATDDSGNFSTATFTVRVQDTLPPVISNMPANITVPAVGGGAFVSWKSPTALDIVDLVRPVTCLPASGSFFPLGTTTVNCTASDTRGNISPPSSFTVTVTSGDTKPPKVCLKLSPGTLSPPNHAMRRIQVILTVRDNQDPTPTCAITSVTSSEPVTGPGYGNTTPDWIFSGLNLQLRAETYSKHGRTYTVTVLCSDDSGNTTTTRGTVRVPKKSGHHKLFEENDTNNNNQSGHCCIRNDRDRDHHDDDDDDDNFTWTNDSTKKGPDDNNNRCFDEDHHDDDDDDNDDDHLTIKTDETKTN